MKSSRIAFYWLVGPGKVCGQEKGGNTAAGSARQEHEGYWSEPATEKHYKKIKQITFSGGTAWFSLHISAFLGNHFSSSIRSPLNPAPHRPPPSNLQYFWNKSNQELTFQPWSIALLWYVCPLLITVLQKYEVESTPLVALDFHIFDIRPCVSCKDPQVHFSRNLMMPFLRHRVGEILVYDGPNLEDVL